MLPTLLITMSLSSKWRPNILGASPPGLSIFIQTCHTNVNNDFINCLRLSIVLFDRNSLPLLLSWLRVHLVHFSGKEFINYRMVEGVKMRTEACFGQIYLKWCAYSQVYELLAWDTERGATLDNASLDNGRSKIKILSCAYISSSRFLAKRSIIRQPLTSTLTPATMGSLRV